MEAAKKRFPTVKIARTAKNVIATRGKKASLAKQKHEQQKRTGHQYHIPDKLIN
jgi:hypothetical protein